MEDRTFDHAQGNKEALQLLLDQFAWTQKDERELRLFEFQHLMSILRSPTGAHSTEAQPLVQNSPNFTKYDGKCDHGAVSQFIHQFVAHFPLAKAPRIWSEPKPEEELREEVRQIYFVLQYTYVIVPSKNFSCTKWYWILICFIRAWNTGFRAIGMQL